MFCYCIEIGLVTHNCSYQEGRGWGCKSWTQQKVHCIGNRHSGQSPQQILTSIATQLHMTMSRFPIGSIETRCNWLKLVKLLDMWLCINVFASTTTTIGHYQQGLQGRGYRCIQQRMQPPLDKTVLHWEPLGKRCDGAPGFHHHRMRSSLSIPPIDSIRSQLK